MHWSKKITIEILIVILIGLVMAFLGPFGTYAMPSGLRIAYWVIFGVIGYALFRPMAVMMHKLRDIIPVPVWVAELLGCMVAALPFSLFVAFMMAGLQWDSALIFRHYGLLYVQCTAVGFGIYLFIYMVFDWLHGNSTVAADTKVDQVAPSRSALHERLPIGFPNQIDALKSEDHYVHVYARDECGDHKEMILMRLSDAIKEVNNIEGLQVHRSWWVAHHAIESCNRDSRKYKLILHNGMEVAVSQARVGDLKTAGYIA